MKHSELPEPIVTLLERARDILATIPEGRGWVASYDELLPVETDVSVLAKFRPPALTIHPPDDVSDQWTVSGDLREIVDVDDESTNYIVHAALVAAGWDPTMFDTEHSCFFAYPADRDEAERLVKQATEIAESMRDES